MPYQAAQMGTHLDAARRLAGPQHDRHGPALLRVVDVDRQEAAFVIMSVEQRELLMAVDDIAGGFATESYAASALYTTLASLSDTLWRIRRARRLVP